jgi:pyruvate carboxylase
MPHEVRSPVGSGPADAPRWLPAAAGSVDTSDEPAVGLVRAPFGGIVVPAVRPGDHVEAGGVVATIEATKMEAAVTSPVAGTVARLAVGRHAHVAGGDVLVVLSAASAPA